MSAATNKLSSDCAVMQQASEPTPSAMASGDRLSASSDELGPSFAHLVRFAAEDAAKAPGSELARRKLGDVIRSGSERQFLCDCKHSGLGRTFWTAAHAMAISFDAAEAEQLSQILTRLIAMRFLDSQKDPPRRNLRADLA